MTCDDAFELLTGPDADISADLQQHLRHCPRCRQMREVLTPAIELLAGDSDRPAAPGRQEHGAVWTDVARIEQAVRQATEDRATSRHSPFPGSRLARVARGGALILLGALAANAWSEHGQGLPHGEAAPGDSGICNRTIAARMIDAGGASPQAVQLAASCIACHHDASR